MPESGLACGGVAIIGQKWKQRMREGKTAPFVDLVVKIATVQRKQDLRRETMALFSVEQRIPLFPAEGLSTNLETMETASKSDYLDRSMAGFFRVRQRRRQCSCSIVAEFSDRLMPTADKSENTRNLIEARHCTLLQVILNFERHQ